MIIHRAESRGKADHGWLQSYHSFSFGQYYDPERIQFGMLRVLNDDTVQPAMGFGTHPHDNMEIISIPLEGALAHRDSMGHTEEIRTGEVQVMSAGTGITHSEFNASRDKQVKFLQIWIFPRERGLEPRYDQKQFPPLNGGAQLMVSPDGRDGSLRINQDAFISRVHLEAGQEFEYSRRFTGNGVYIFVLDGEIELGGEQLQSRDAAGLDENEDSGISAGMESNVLIIEVPLN